MKPFFARAAERLHHDPEPTRDGYRLVVTRPNGLTTNSRVGDLQTALAEAVVAASEGKSVCVVCVETGAVIYRTLSGSAPGDDAANDI